MLSFHITLRVCVAATLLTRAISGGAEFITRAAAIQALSREEAGRKLPVRIRGVVVWRGSTRDPNFVVDDGERGVYVCCLRAIDPSMVPVVFENGDHPETTTEPGALVEIEGVSNPGGWAPIIMASRVRRVGTAPLPAPRHVPLEFLLAGNADSQRVEVEGVVQTVEKPDARGVTMISLMADGHRWWVNFDHGREIIAASLVDARVRVRGVLGPRLNLRSEVFSNNINTMGAADLDILVPPPVDPFQSPRVALDRLLPFSPDGAPFHRRVTQGVVILASPGRFFFLQAGNTGVRVDSATAEVKVGERVEVAGFAEMDSAVASMREGIVRSLGAAQVTEPLETSAKELIEPTLRHPLGNPDCYDYNGRLVKLKAKLIRTAFDEMEGRQHLLVESDGQTFSAVPSNSGPEWLASSTAWMEGSELTLTGVCELEFGEMAPKRDYPLAITGFHLLLRSPGDIGVLSQPSWWTSARLRFTLVWAGILIGLGLVWISMLRWLLRQRAKRLEDVMRSHRDTELEYASAQRERLRLAVDLHDGIKQNLVAASYRVIAATGHLPDTADVSAGHLASAHDTLLRTQTELEECIWGLRAVAEGPPDFVHLLDHVSNSGEHWPKGAVTISSEGTYHRLPRDVAGSLLLLFQEACGNAFRHGCASRIAVTVSYGTNTFDLRIVDDGTGFDARTAPGSESGHFGIDGMKLRMRWLGGTLRITRHSTGMEIHACIPWRTLRSLANDFPADPLHASLAETS